MQASDQNAVIVDARGLMCPEPLVLARRTLRGLRAGSIIELWATDPLASLDIEALCARGACHYQGCVAGADGVWRIRIECR